MYVTRFVMISIRVDFLLRWCVCCLNVQDGCTALFLAIHKQRCDLVKVFIAEGSDIEKTDNVGTLIALLYHHYILCVHRTILPLYLQLSLADSL